MRALLVNPWIYDFAAYDLWSKPLGLLRIASFLKRCKVKIDLIDCLDRNHPALKTYLRKMPRSSFYGCGNYYFELIEKPKILKSIPRRYKRYGMPRELFERLIKRQSRPDIILITSGMTYWYPGVLEVVEILKKRFKGIPIILGGIYARLCPEHAKKNIPVDFIYSGNNLFEIAELIFKITRYNFEYLRIKQKPFFYAYELYPKLEAVSLRTSSGCPFRCSYCGWYLLEDGFRYNFTQDFIVEKIAYFFKVKGVKNFAFYDDAFLYNACQHAIKIMQKLIKRKIKANFHTPNGLNIRYITKEIARLLKASGFIRPRLGLEFIFKKKENLTNIKATKEEFLKAIGYLKEAGYPSKDIGVNIMIGLPEEDYFEIEETVKFVASQKVRIHLEEYAPVPGTPDFFKAGLTYDSDPLLHNNSAFLYLNKDASRLEALKDMVHKYNAQIIYS
ncbi:MAG: radical SAM protein [Candidatus Omnitrophica bacterium]|nr:radical SAM protein [Candidatus Omnitrophota bacterium]